MRSSVIGVCLLALAGCDVAVPGNPVRMVGGPGTIDGRFITPRCVTIDPRGFVYVLDKTGRIQKFRLDGQFERAWRTPATEKGRPTSIAIDAGGFVWVADTHYHRILKYSPEGDLVFQFGREGTGPAEFIYPVGIQIAEDGMMFVSEFGGNDRIQVFDASGKFVRQWGSFGERDDQFKRPQGLALSKSGTLFVADSSNHRIVVYDREGRRLAIFGGYGDALGSLKYPYGVALASDGTLLVAEYGNHRIQRFSEDGRPLAVHGLPGAGPGELNTPWSVATDSQNNIYVCDTGNHRIQIWTSQRSFQSYRSEGAR